MLFKIASFNCEAFWKMDANMDKSPFDFSGGPRGGNSIGWKLGLAIFEAGFEPCPDLFPDDELVELCDFPSLKLVAVLVTNRLEGRESRGDSEACALVKVSV